MQRHQRVVELGGLYVLGTERHESRRIDNQLRGRSGRQGDPGKSRFYLSLEDNLLRIFGGDRLQSMMKYMGAEKGMALESKLLSRSIEKAQRKVEAHHFDIRKQLLEYDDVANEQRKVIYRERNSLLQAEHIQDTIFEMIPHVMSQVVYAFVPPETMPEEWDLGGLEQRLLQEFQLTLPVQAWLQENPALEAMALIERISEAFKTAYQQKETQMGAPLLRQLEKAILLQTLDLSWREHLAAMDYLRQGIHLRGYAQKNPKQEYKRESFELFGQLIDRMHYNVISTLSKLEIREEQADTADTVTPPSPLAALTYEHATADAFEEIESPASAAKVTDAKVGRNELCPCGSGRKYKLCHGRLE